MAIVIDASDVLTNKKSLPIEGFFVDTNILIYYKDPFSASLNNPRLTNLNTKITDFLNRPNSSGIKGYSSLSVAIEFYKFLQVGYFKTQFPNTKFSTESFKKAKYNDENFRNGFSIYFTYFKKYFKKDFPLTSINSSGLDYISDFDVIKSDFGDHALLKAVLAHDKKLHGIFTGDSDFYNYSEDFYLITFNNSIIKMAVTDNKIWKS